MTDARADYASRVASVLTGAGFPRMPANVLMALMSTDEAGLTAAQLAERLEASAAAISGAVRYLEGVRMVRRHRALGERRDSWELVDDSWYTATLRSPAIYDEIVRLSRDEAERLPAGSVARGRIEEMAEFMAFVREALPRMLDEWYATRGPSTPD